MNRLTIAAGAAISLLLGATAFAQESTPVPAPAPTTASAPAPAAAPASAEKGHIIFYRPSHLTGAIYTYHIVEVGDDGKPAKDAPTLGDLPNGGAFTLDADAGIHSYNVTGPMAVNKAEDRLRMEVEPGATYYVEQTVRMGMLTGGFRLEPTDQARFTASKAKMDKGKK